MKTENEIFSEGWADFIGYNFAARKYPAPITVWDGTRNTEKKVPIALLF